MDKASTQAHDLLGATADIVSAFVGNNALQGADLAALIGEVHSALTRLGGPAVPEQEKPIPAVSVKKSITPDYLISLEDGKRYKTLRRHLSGRGLTPAEYRAKWSLPADYPMSAPNYSAQRSELARSFGLGQQRKGKTAAASKPAPEPVKAEAPKRRGRAAKTLETA